MYDHMLKKIFGPRLRIDCIWEKDEIGMLTVRGAIAVAGDILKSAKQGKEP
jgi:hypothetical protein